MGINTKSVLLNIFIDKVEENKQYVCDTDGYANLGGVVNIARTEK